MSNNPILPIVPGAAVAAAGMDNDEDELQANNPDLDEGESADSQDTVEKDLKEGKSVNEELDK
ncbi:MAG TPA: hypothetical protein VHX87_05970 [Galbitalea sp.]|jgi:hypothetical protein|nr:hypothetical protein [Galbitalea sp.]